jgi:hypothetical protein
MNFLLSFIEVPFYVSMLHFLLEIAEADPDGFVSLQVGASTCFYFGTNPIWPFPAGATWTRNAADTECKKIGLRLAVIADVSEQNAIRNFLRKNVYGVTH